MVTVEVITMVIYIYISGYDMIYKLNHVYMYIYGSVHYTQLLEADYG